MWSLTLVFGKPDRFLRLQRDHHHRIAIRRAIQRQARTSAFESQREYPVKKYPTDLVIWFHVVFVQIDLFKFRKNIDSRSGELIRW